MGIKHSAWSWKSKRNPGMWESITVRDKEVLVQLDKALVRLPLQYCIHCSDNPCLRKIN